MSKSILFTNAVLTSRQNKLLNADRIKRMINAQSAQEAAKILFECGYNEEIITFQPEKDDLIIGYELEKTVKTFKEFCPDEKLKECVLAKFDYHNAKVLYKSKFVKIDLYETLYSFGNVDVELLKKSIESKRYLDMPVGLAQVIEKLDKTKNPTLRDIDLQFEKAMYEYIAENIKGLKNASIIKYFKTEIDIINQRTYLKCQLYKTEKDFEAFFIKGGFKKKDEMRKDISDIAEFEEKSNDLLREIGHEGKDDNFGLNVMFNWFNLKIEELKVVKMILLGKKLGLSRRQIKDNLKGAYEEFK